MPQILEIWIASGFASAHDGGGRFSICLRIQILIQTILILFQNLTFYILTFSDSKANSEARLLDSRLISEAIPTPSCANLSLLSRSNPLSSLLSLRALRSKAWQSILLGGLFCLLLCLAFVFLRFYLLWLTQFNFQILCFFFFSFVLWF